MGSDEAVCVNWVIVDVSIHAPTWGATEVVRAIRIGIPFQPTLPHGERRPNKDSSNSKTRVSIHAPTRGATMDPTEQTSHPGVSIHAPTRGATSGEVRIRWGTKFQSTLPHGERL